MAEEKFEIKGEPIKTIVREGFTQAIHGNELWANTTTDERVLIAFKDNKLAWDLYCKKVRITIEVFE